MISLKKFRVLLLALLSVSVTFVLFYGRPVLELAPSDKAVSGNTLIELANNAKQDAAINKEISKTKNEGDTVADADKGEDLGQFDAAKEFLEIRLVAPMVVFSKTYCPFSKKLKKLLHDNYSITPEPTFVELDKHKHGHALQEYVAKITERRTVPNVVLGKLTTASRGGADDFVRLHQEGKLADMLNEWGDKALSVVRIEAPSNV